MLCRQDYCPTLPHFRASETKRAPQKGLCAFSPRNNEAQPHFTFDVDWSGGGQAAHDQPCLGDLSVGCCHDYRKLMEPNEPSTGELKGPAILLGVGGGLGDRSILCYVYRGVNNHQKKGWVGVFVWFIARKLKKQAYPRLLSRARNVSKLPF